MEDAGAFDDLVFRYRLIEPDVWKTCFIKLKHMKTGGYNSAFKSEKNIWRF
jgi:hypothetical protein